MFRNSKRKRLRRLEDTVQKQIRTIEQMREQPTMLILSSQEQVDSLAKVLKDFVRLESDDEQHIIQIPYDGNVRAVHVCSPVSECDPDYRGTGIWISPTGRCTPGMENSPPPVEAGGMNRSDGLG